MWSVQLQSELVQQRKREVLLAYLVRDLAGVNELPLEFGQRTRICFQELFHCSRERLADQVAIVIGNSKCEPMVVQLGIPGTPQEH